MATTYTISLEGAPQMSGEYFEVDDVTFTQISVDVYVKLSSTWWKLMPNTYILHESESPVLVQMTANVNCHTEGSEQICALGESGSGGLPN